MSERTSLNGFFAVQGPLGGRFKVRPCFYPPVLKEILLMSRLASSKTAQICAERIAQGERSNAPVAQAYPGRRFALPWAISFCPFGAVGVRWLIRRPPAGLLPQQDGA